MLKIPDSKSSGVGYWNKKPGQGDIVYCNYIPVQSKETSEERKARHRRERAGKTFATVNMTDENPYHRGKRGEVVERLEVDGKMMNLLRIDTINRISPDGHSTLVGVSKAAYSDVWFSEDEICDFTTYDENGDPI